MISVIIPTKDRLQTLKSVLPSYLSQNIIDEIIIINDASKDNTHNYISSLLKAESKIKYHKNSVNIGLSGSRNIGISLAKNEYLFFGEDDLELPDNYFEVLIKHLKNNNADIIAGRRIWMQPGETKNTAKQRADSYKGTPVDKNLLITNFQIATLTDQLSPFLDASMLVNKKVFNKVIFDHINYKGNYWREESDFQINAWNNGFKLLFCPHIVAYHLPKYNDKGGCHSSSNLNYEMFVVKNNLNFIKKNKHILEKIFKQNYGFIYIFIFTIHRIKNNIIIPFFINNKRKLINFYTHL